MNISLTTSYSFFNPKLSLFLQSIRNTFFFGGFHSFSCIKGTETMSEEGVKFWAVRCECSHVHLFPSLGRLSELLPGSIQVIVWWLPLSYCRGNGEAMISAHGPKLLATKRCTRIQTLRSKALTWKETPSLNHACPLTISCSPQGSSIFTHHPQCFNTAIGSCLHLHFAKANEVCSKPVLHSSEYLCSPLSQF